MGPGEFAYKYQIVLFQLTHFGPMMSYISTNFYLSSMEFCGTYLSPIQANAQGIIS